MSNRSILVEHPTLRAVLKKNASFDAFFLAFKLMCWRVLACVDAQFEFD